MEEKNSSGESEEPPNRRKKTSVLEPEKGMGLFLLAENSEVISEIGQCFNLWEEFSPKKTLFDIWEFRFAFYLGYGYKPYFLVLKRNSTEGGHPENLALLPLWYDESKKKYTWFGSDWQEEVNFFTRDPNYIPLLISLAPTPLYLNAIARDSIEPIKEKIKFEEDDPKYVLALEKFRSYEDYLMSLKKNKRRNLRKDRNRILKQNPEIIINNFADFNELIELSKKRFQEKGEETDWEDPRRIKTFEEVLKLGGKSYQTRMLTVKIGQKIAGVDLICLYNKTYFALKCGYDVLNFPGIGNFINLFEIDDAIKLGMEKIDFLQNSYNWKNQYFKSVPLFKYDRN